MCLALISPAASAIPHARRNPDENAGKALAGIHLPTAERLLLHCSNISDETATVPPRLVETRLKKNLSSQNANFRHLKDVTVSSIHHFFYFNVFSSDISVVFLFLRVSANARSPTIFQSPASVATPGGPAGGLMQTHCQNILCVSESISGDVSGA